MNNYLYETIFFTIEFLKLLLSMCLLLNYQIRNKMGILLSYVFSVSIIITILIFFPAFEFTYFDGLLTIFIISMNLNGKKKWLISALVYFLICLMDVVVMTFVLLITGISSEDMLYKSGQDLLWNTVSIAIILLLYGIKTKKRIVLQYYQGIKAKNIILAIIGVSCIGTYLAPMQILGFNNSGFTYKNIIILCAGISVIIFGMIGIFLLINNEEKQSYKELLSANEKLIESQKNYYQLLINNNEEARKFRHDITNHLFCMKILLEEDNYEDLKIYLEDMTNIVKELNIKIQTGNDMLNIVLLNVLSQFEENNIPIIWKGLLPNNVTISNMDICTIFSNLFKNALEATEKAVEKYINVEVKLLEFSLYMLIQNPVIRNIKISNNQLVTDKSNKEIHGLGSLNIEKCLNKYQGSIKYSCNNNVFSSEIIIPNIIK